MISRICSFRFWPLGKRMFLVELTQWLGSFVIRSTAGKFFFAAKISFPFLVLTEHLQASFNSMISPPVFSKRFAVTNFNWNLTGFPWPSIESIISRTSHNRIKVEFTGAIVQWRGRIIKDSIFPVGLNQKAPVSRGSLYYLNLIWKEIIEGKLILFSLDKIHKFVKRQDFVLETFRKAR